MRLSSETLLLLARAGDKPAEGAVLFIELHDRTATAWTCGDGRIGAGWPGLRAAEYVERASEPRIDRAGFLSETLAAAAVSAKAAVSL